MRCMICHNEEDGSCRKLHPHTKVLQAVSEPDQPYYTAVLASIERRAREAEAKRLRRLYFLKIAHLCLWVALFLGLVIGWVFF